MRALPLLSLFLLVLSAGPLWAHGGGHDEGPSLSSPEIPTEHSEHSMMQDSGHHEGHAAAEEPVTYGMQKMAEPQGGGTYGIEPEGPEGEGTYGLEPPAEDHSMHQEPEANPSLFENPLADMTPATPATEHAEGHSMDGHSMAMGGHEQHVEPAPFKSVSSDVPGRGMAVGITVLSGLVFGLLCLVRPFEKQ